MLSSTCKKQNKICTKYQSHTRNNTVVFLLLIPSVHCSQVEEFCFGGKHTLICFQPFYMLNKQIYKYFWCKLTAQSKLIKLI